MSTTGTGNLTDLPTDTTDFNLTETDQTDTDYEDNTEYTFTDYVEEEEDLELSRYQPIQIHYNSSDYISGYYMSETCTVPANILEFDHSYGYDCKRYFNLVVADASTLIFASGNYIHILDVTTGAVNFRRSALGGGIGHITKNPVDDYPHIAIAENGNDPPILIYEWPSLDVVTVLHGGASLSFTNLNYSPNGKLLVSQGGEPDYLITVWNWPASRILLRTKSSVNDVIKVMFSPSVPGHLTSCGLSHIKFWKMSRTFTGLKLKGELGRFGKTEYSDIVGIYPMPDEKVLSGCSWGNILVWDEGLIKLEVYRKLRKKCHDAPIVQFDYRDGELWTVSMDGHVRVWYYESIDQADPPDDDRVVQIEPSYDFYTPNTELMCIEKRNLFANDTFYYAQDGNGGIWLIDLTTDIEVSPSVQLLLCHAGKVMDIVACPWGSMLASLGEDGRLFIYNYLLKIKLLTHQFPAKGRCMLWIPLTISPSGEMIIMGFDDGNLRVALVQMEYEKMTLTLVQVIKPHTKPVTAISINPIETILVSGGEDSTIFIFEISHNDPSCMELLPIGYIPMPDPVSCLTWNITNDTSIIVGCVHGQIVEAELPTTVQDYTTITYILNVQTSSIRFETYKSQIRRDIKIAQINARKDKKRERKRAEMMKILKDNPGLEIDEELFLQDSDSEEELEPLFIPEEPNRINWIQHMPNENLWLSMAGYDAGYIYEYNMKQNDTIPLRFKMVEDADDIEICSYAYNYNKHYLILAMKDGSIRVNKFNPEDFRDLRDYWKLSMHDNFNGCIPKVCFSFDEHYFFSCGYDGNIFSYRYNPKGHDYADVKATRIPSDETPTAVLDDYDRKSLSLEEAIVKKEQDRINRLAQEHKDAVIAILHKLRKRYVDMLDKNSKLLPTQIIPRLELEPDERVDQDLNERLNANLELVKRKLAFAVEKSEVAMMKLKAHFTDPLDVFPITVRGVRINNALRVMRQRKLNPEFFELQAMVEKKILEEELRSRGLQQKVKAPKRASIQKQEFPTFKARERAVEFFLSGLSSSTVKLRLGAKLNRLLQKYRQRKAIKEKRQYEWDKFNWSRPVDGENHPDDVAALAEAEDTIGDFKLKTAKDYKVPAHLRESTLKKYRQLLKARLEQYELRHLFNIKVYEMRKKKIDVQKRLSELQKKMFDLQTEIPKKLHEIGPDVFEISPNDFPEKNLNIQVEIKSLRFKPHAMERAHPIVLYNKSHDIIEREVLESIPTYDDVQDELTPWELDAKTIRVKRKLFEQSLVVREMHSIIEEFDDELLELWKERFHVKVDANFMDLHLLTLNQELFILRDFEVHENELSQNVHAKMFDLMDSQDKITEITKDIETNKREVEHLRESAEGVVQQFHTTMSDYKFYDFLRRIFKKKYRPPKIRNPDDSESDSDSSSDSESEEEDAASIDSRDIGVIRLDESVCPKGCDQGLYDMTFALRTRRHGFELAEKDRLRDVENLTKDLANANKQTRIVENNLKFVQQELEAFQRLKQQKLNEVMSTVVLNINQIQNLTKNNTLEAIKDSLIFSKTDLTKLYKRVGQLKTETIQQKSKHNKNVRHLCRMNTDLTHMTASMERLRDKIIQTMRMKFGGTKPDFSEIEQMQGIEVKKKTLALVPAKVAKKDDQKQRAKITLDEIEECVIKRLVFNLRMGMIDFRSMYEEEVALWKRTHEKKLKEQADIIRFNTRKMELIGVLKKEIREMTAHTTKRLQKAVMWDGVMDLSKNIRGELGKLEEIAEGQRTDLDILRAEIKRLKTKGLKPITPNEFPEQPVVEDDVSSDWSDYEGYFKKIDGEEEVGETEEHDTPSQRCDSAFGMVRSVLRDMCDNLDMNILDAYDTAALLKRSSLASIIDDLVAKVNRTLDEKEMVIVEVTAEKIYSLQEADLSPHEIEECSWEILQSILDKATGLTNEIAVNLLTELINTLPINYLLTKECICHISERLSNEMSKTYDILDAEWIGNEVLENLPGRLMQDARIVLEQIMQRVFDTGIDFVYFIKE